jgi:uncharacterized protein (TIGR02147 family)
MNSDNCAFRNVLQEEFLQRTKRNPRFSIRSFANQLEVEPSSLAQILSGKRKLTDKMCDRLGLKLGMTPAKLRNAKRSSIKKDNFKNFGHLEEDAFKVIADWHYYAILELTSTDDFKGSPLWISRRLGLSFAETLDAIERLKRLKYLEITPDGRWIDRLGDTNNLGNSFQRPAFTEHQRQVLKKAMQALDNTPYEERVQSSMTVTVSKKKVKEAKSMILSFIDELNDFLRSDDTKDEIYNISVSLYPLTTPTKGDPDA